MPVSRPLRILGVIPARIASTRLPRKPLLPLGGIPMIRRVYENMAHSSLFTELLVATDSPEIAAVLPQQAVRMSAPEIPSGSDRVAAVARDYPDMDIIVNVQGDEPFLQAHHIEDLLSPYLQGQLPPMTTLASPLKEGDLENPGVVKVLLNRQQQALYFSRSPIPYPRAHSAHPVPVYHHMGVYAYRRDFLLEYSAWPPTPLEQTESLEQLRVLENGYAIQVCCTQKGTLEINTQEEYQQACTLFVASS